jgi:predicted DNA-binding protein (MmcQ/YjbR family)
MSKLIFTMKYADKKWPEYLEETFGKETAEKCVVESTQTASIHEARIHIMDFKNDSAIINLLKNNEQVTSAFLVNNKEAVRAIK